MGCLLWLLNNFRCPQFTTRKLAKFMCSLDREHFAAMTHMMNHTRRNHMIGLTSHSDVMDTPLSRLLLEYDGMEPTAPLTTLSDLPWRDWPDSGRRTGEYSFPFQGRIIGSASNFPDLVALLPSTEAEYNQACEVALT